MRLISGIVTLVYLLVGVLIASDHHYFAHVNDLQQVISAVLAVALWPLILLGVDLHLGSNDAGRAGAIWLWFRSFGGG
jgi:cell shape-determining protein MreD